MSNLMDMQVDPAFCVGDEGKITLWNRPAEVRFGYAANEAVGRHYAFLFDEDRIPFRQSAEQALTYSIHGWLFNIPVVVRHASGTLLDCTLNRLRLTQPPTPQTTLPGLEEVEEHHEIFILHNISEVVALQVEVSGMRGALHELLKAELSSGPSEELERLYEAILVAVSSGRGLRFNRAFLLVMNEQSTEMRGALAIGPGSSEEAALIYTRSDSFKTLSEEIAYYQRRPEETDRLVNLMVGAVKLPMKGLGRQWMEELTTLPYRLVDEQRMAYEPAPVRWLAGKLRTHRFVIATLSWQGIPLGLLVADNPITHAPISREDVLGLIQVAEAASQAIQDARFLEAIKRNTLRLQNASLELKQSQQRIRINERLSTMGTLMAELTHELRNPLVVVGGYLQRLSKKTAGNPELAPDLEVVAHSVDRMEQILNRYVERIKHREQPTEEGELNRVVESVVEMLWDELESRHIALRVATQAARLEVMVSEVQLFEVFYNLISNAIQAMKEGGIIQVALGRENGKIKAVVMDSGPGIPEEMQKKLFTPFFTTRPEGLGLGLSLTKEIIETHQGTINLTSQPGKGTTVTVLLPAVYHPAAPEAPQSG